MAPKRKAEDRNAQQRKAPYRNAHRSSSSHPPPNVSMPVLPTEIRLVIIPYYLDNLITSTTLSRSNKPFSHFTNHNIRSDLAQV